MGNTSRLLPVARRTDGGLPLRPRGDRRRTPRSAFWPAAAVAAATLIGHSPRTSRAEPDPPAPGRSAASARERENAPRVARRSTAPVANTVLAQASPDAIAAAKNAVADCQAEYAKVRDYTCTFLKRERIDGRLTHAHVMDMKARTHPLSIYFKFRTPNKGREAIFVAGRNGGKILAHDVGIGKFLAGTMNLDPRGSMAMEDCRHPITEAGLGALIETVARHWNAELTPGESRVSFHPSMRIGTHACSMVETVHPSRQPDFLFHKVRLYIDHEHGLPIRFEAYDWPARPGASPELVEEYTYLELKVNVGLGDKDFDPGNKLYSFGRF